MRSTALLLLLAAAATMEAAAATGWDRLSVLHSGDRITVIQTDHSQHAAEFVRVSSSALTIRDGGNERTVPRPEIERVQSAAKNVSARNLAIGAAIGVAIAIATDRTFGVLLNNEGGYSSGTKAAVWTVPIAGGAAIGGFTGRTRTIYRK